MEQQNKNPTPQDITRAYPDARCSVMTPDNFMEFLTSGMDEQLL
jgi:hypothetical protein